MYSSGLLKDRITIIIPGEITDTAYGREQADSATTIQRWAAVDWARGTKALREGAIDAYDTIMVRMYYDSQITRECKIQYNGTTYAIQSLHADKQANTIQITATELVS